MKGDPMKLLLLTAFLAASAVADIYQEAARYRFGDSREPIAAIESEIRRATPAQYPAIETKLLAILQSPDTTTDARRLLIRQLTIVGSVRSVPVLAAWLGDEQLSDVARLALEPMPEAEAGRALRDALLRVKGKLLDGIIGSVAVRRDEAAVSALAQLARENQAAITALGEIGTSSAARALDSLPPSVAVSRARLACAARLQSAAMFQALLDDVRQPSFIRAAALVGLNSAPVALKYLQGDDAALKAAALRAFVTGDAVFQRNVVAQLPALTPAAQVAVLVALADLPAVPARADILRTLDATKDDAVRSAALEALVTHGEADDVPMLLKCGAVSVLERMRNPRVNNALVERVKSADPTVVALVGKRRIVAALPLLAELVTKNEAAGDAIAAICGRAEDRPACAAALLAVRAETPAAKMAILRLLPRVRTAEALAAVYQATKDSDAQVSEVAVRALADWPEVTAAVPLLEVARTTKEPKLAVIALRGCARLAGGRDAAVTDRLQWLRGILETAQRPDEKRLALAGMAGLGVIEALDVLQSCLKDETVARDAATAIVRLAKDIGPVYRGRFEPLLQQIKPLVAVDEALAALKNTGQADGYITAWLLAGPYMKEGKGANELFHEIFPPEQPGAPGVAWKMIAVPPSSGPRILRLEKILGGNDRVVYVQTRIESDKEQEIVLENGSDDGAKIWLNGQVVLSANAVRPCTPGSEKARLKLRSGVNTLLVKITQGGGEWQLCVRLRGLDGGEVKGISVGPSLD